MAHEIIQHLHDNWHKYGVAFLLIKEVKSVYEFFSNLKSFKEAIDWTIEKAKKLFKKS